MQARLHSSADAEEKLFTNPLITVVSWNRKLSEYLEQPEMQSYLSSLEQLEMQSYQSSLEKLVMQNYQSSLKQLAMKNYQSSLEQLEMKTIRVVWNSL